MTTENECEYIPATSAMTTHLRLLAEVAEEALANHASLVEGLERSIREAARYGSIVDEGETGQRDGRVRAEPPVAIRRRRHEAVLTAVSSLVGKIAFA